MKRKIFVNKFEQIKHDISECLPNGSKIHPLDAQSVIIVLPNAHNRKEILAACKKRVGETKASLIQPVSGYKETPDSVEVSLPSMKRFFPKKI